MIKYKKLVAICAVCTLVAYIIIVSALYSKKIITLGKNNIILFGTLLVLFLTIAIVSIVFLRCCNNVNDKSQISSSLSNGLEDDVTNSDVLDSKEQAVEPLKTESGLNSATSDESVDHSVEKTNDLETCDKGDAVELDAKQRSSESGITTNSNSGIPSISDSDFKDQNSGTNAAVDNSSSSTGDGSVKAEDKNQGLKSNTIAHDSRDSALNESVTDREDNKDVSEIGAEKPYHEAEGIKLNEKQDSAGSEVTAANSFGVPSISDPDFKDQNSGTNAAVNSSSSSTSGDSVKAEDKNQGFESNPVGHEDSALNESVTDREGNKDVSEIDAEKHHNEANDIKLNEKQDSSVSEVTAANSFGVPSISDPDFKDQNSDTNAAVDNSPSSTSGDSVKAEDKNQGFESNPVGHEDSALNESVTDKEGNKDVSEIDAEKHHNEANDIKLNEKQHSSVSEVTAANGFGVPSISDPDFKDQNSGTNAAVDNIPSSTSGDSVEAEDKNQGFGSNPMGHDSGDSALNESVTDREDNKGVSEIGAEKHHHEANDIKLNEKQGSSVSEVTAANSFGVPSTADPDFKDQNSDITNAVRNSLSSTGDDVVEEESLDSISYPVLLECEEDIEDDNDIDDVWDISDLDGLSQYSNPFSKLDSVKDGGQVGSFSEENVNQRKMRSLVLLKPRYVMSDIPKIAEEEMCYDGERINIYNVRGDIDSPLLTDYYKQHNKKSSENVNDSTQRFCPEIEELIAIAKEFIDDNTEELPYNEDIVSDVRKPFTCSDQAKHENDVPVPTTKPTDDTSTSESVSGETVLKRADSNIKLIGNSKSEKPLVRTRSTIKRSKSSETSIQEPCNKSDKTYGNRVIKHGYSDSKLNSTNNQTDIKKHSSNVTLDGRTRRLKTKNAFVPLKRERSVSGIDVDHFSEFNNLVRDFYSNISVMSRSVSDFASCKKRKNLDFNNFRVYIFYRNFIREFDFMLFKFYEKYGSKAHEVDLLKLCTENPSSTVETCDMELDIKKMVLYSRIICYQNSLLDFYGKSTRALIKKFAGIEAGDLSDLVNRARNLLFSNVYFFPSKQILEEKITQLVERICRTEKISQNYYTGIHNNLCMIQILKYSFIYDIDDMRTKIDEAFDKLTSMSSHVNSGNRNTEHKMQHFMDYNSESIFSRISSNDVTYTAILSALNKKRSTLQEQSITPVGRQIVK